MTTELLPNPGPLHVMLCCPTGGSIMHMATHRALVSHGWPVGFKMSRMDIGSSALTYCFNQMWAMALSGRKSHGITHFAMLHNDTWVEEGWLGKLLEILQEHQKPDAFPAPLVSVCSPIKSNLGVTCTALDTDPWHPRRLTMKERIKLPVNLSTEAAWDLLPGNLMVGAGAWLADIRPVEIPGAGLTDWAASISFRFDDRIVEVRPGEFEALFAPENWNFSRDMLMMGLHVIDTIAVKLKHYDGQVSYNNWEPWGLLETDGK